MSKTVILITAEGLDDLPPEQLQELMTELEIVARRHLQQATVDVGHMVTGATLGLDGPPDWAARLRAIREDMRLSQRAVARRMGTQQSALSELENGLTPSPSFYTLQKWAAEVGARFVMLIAR